jgi:hypothetical protein
MPNEDEPVAKPKEGSLVEYICPVCGGWDRGCEVYYAFLPFIDHLIRDLCIVQHARLKQPFLVGDRIWYRIPDTDEILYGLPPYEPNSREWKKLLDKGQKILPQAKLFLPDIADWLEKVLLPIEALNSIEKSDLSVAEQLVKLVQALPPEAQEQREYLLQHEETLKETGMDPKWLGGPGRQAGFVARSMAGARWSLTPSSSRELIRQVRRTPRVQALQTIGINKEGRWWEP